MSVIRRCVCCNKEYEYCPGCPKKDQPGWMVTFCSEPCKELFNVVSAYNAKRIGKPVVKKYVSEHSLDANNYTGPVRKVLDEVMVAAEVPVDTSTVKAAPVMEAAKVVAIDETPAQTSNNGGEPYDHRSRRAKKRKHRQFGY